MVFSTSLYNLSNLCEAFFLFGSKTSQLVMFDKHIRISTPEEHWSLNLLHYLLQYHGTKNVVKVALNSASVPICTPGCEALEPTGS